MEAVLKRRWCTCDCTVDELMLRPDGSEPLVMLHVAAPPVLEGVMVPMELSLNVRVNR